VKIELIFEQDCLSVVDKCIQRRIFTRLFCRGVRKKKPNLILLKWLWLIINSQRERNAIPFAVFKPTGLGRFYLYQKKGEGKAFTTARTRREWNRVEQRFESVCKSVLKRRSLTYWWKEVGCRCSRWISEKWWI
jgi:proline dehydrogenase